MFPIFDKINKMIIDNNLPADMFGDIICSKNKIKHIKIKIKSCYMNNYGNLIYKYQIMPNDYYSNPQKYDYVSEPENIMIEKIHRMILKWNNEEKTTNNITTNNRSNYNSGKIKMNNSTNENVKNIVKNNTKIDPETNCLKDEEQNNEVIFNTSFKRNVYEADTFIKSFDNYKNYGSKNKNKIDNQFYKLVYKYQTEDLETIIEAKHMHPVYDSTGLPLYRNHFSDSDNLPRIYFSLGKDFKRPGMNDNDIVFLYFTIGKKDHDNYIALINSKNFIYKNEIELLDEYQFSKGEIFYKIKKSEKDNKYKRIPVLSQKQLDVIKTKKPPIVVSGCAGSGKTITSEEAYKQYSKIGDGLNIIYVTYLNRLRDQVESDLFEIENPNCVTIDELLFRQCPDTNKYKMYDDFIKWIESEDTKIKFKQMKIDISDVSSSLDTACSIIYLFFRTYSFQDDSDEFVNYDLFSKIIKKEKGINEKQLKIIHSICSTYENYIVSNEYMTDNKAARDLIKIEHELFDAIIVDEVQDLTLKQIEFLLSSLKRGSLDFYAFGDDNQSINPTLLRLDEVANKLNDMSNIYQISISEDKIVELPYSYRSSSYLCKYLNYLNIIKDRSIGKIAFSTNISTIKTKSDDNTLDKPAFLLDVDITNNFIDEKLFLQNDLVIITPNITVKNHLIRKYESSVPGISEYISTIEETKGREWDVVILYNFLSSLEDVWTNIIIHFKEKNSLKSTIDRMYFNRYYVGLSRAKSKVIIAESKELDEQIKKYFLTLDNEVNNSGIYSHLLTEITSKSILENYFKNNHTPDVWFEMADESFNNKDYEAACDRIKKAIRGLEVSNINSELYEKYLEKEKKYKLYNEAFSSIAIDSITYETCLEGFLEMKDINAVINLYKKKDYKKYDLLIEKDPHLFINKFNILDKQLLNKKERELIYCLAVGMYSKKIIKQLEEQ